MRFPHRSVLTTQMCLSRTAEQPFHPSLQPFERVSLGRLGEAPRRDVRKVKAAFKIKPKRSLLVWHPRCSAVLELGRAAHAGQSANNTRGSEGKELCTIAKT